MKKKPLRSKGALRRRPIPACCIKHYQRWLADPEDLRRVGWDLIIGPRGDKVEISTVFLATNIYTLFGPPHYFETMVFGGDMNDHQRRYETWEEAEEGHDEVVEKVKYLLNRDWNWRDLA